MQLTLFTDYGLRLMMFVAVSDGRRVTIEEVARAYDISRSHLMKVAQVLIRENLLKASRGRTGGLNLARSAENVSIGAIVRATEAGFDLVECQRQQGNCRMGQVCRLRGILLDALNAFFEVLDRHTLADLIARPSDFSFLSDVRVQSSQ
ncbi:Rrf2 family transcriptional regulator [Rhizobiales bacterium RZME27]|jgi:Rrf2 family nitric oxide-sensitive transcriptional repressor|uniref:Rrf2 family transcriptional regulator n=1 Tax=Endobacterium cereale TaxID=2663029 RepID=A0A6A8A7Z5_9HYPH|nr:Rrf2 family transcriptional regulator [Endobacterium cereale]MEB2846471.1 Rrf2 family transcriptional regulator [Endobacterium cereale]MQY45780.1 Rrf2 family transcriptional regulator [Endobacterium cereale]